MTMTRVIIFALAAATSWATVEAQDGVSGSESFIAAGGAVTSAGGVAFSPQYASSSGVNAGTAVTASSQSFTAIGGGVAPIEPWSPTIPVVLGVVPSAIPAMPTQQLELRGFGFNGLAVPATVDVAGTSASGSFVASNTSILFTPSTGVNAAGNPLGSATVTVPGAAGLAELLVMPSLVQDVPASIGGVFSSMVTSEPGSPYVLILGGPATGTFAQVPPFTGALEVLDGTQVYRIGAIGASGADAIVVAIPNMPHLVGARVSMQALVVDVTVLPALAGAFTNAITFSIQ